MLTSSSGKPDHRTADLLKESGRLIRTATLPLTSTVATVPKPKSLSAFIDSFQHHPIQDKPLAEQVRQKPWAKLLSEAELQTILSIQPSISSDGMVTKKRLYRTDWRNKLSGIMPNAHLPAIERLNQELSARMGRQAPEIKVRKAPEKWTGVKITAEPIDEAILSESERVGDDDEIEELNGKEHKSESEASVEARDLVIQSDSEEDKADQKDKVQTDISTFFGGNGNPERTSKLIDGKKLKRETRLRREFLDEEAEESDSDEDTENIGNKKKKRTRRIIDDDEFIDEEEIRRELEASKFIAEDNEVVAASSVPINNIHNQLEKARDAAVLQEIVDRFARDKLDPKSRHITTLVDKYSTRTDNEATAPPTLPHPTSELSEEDPLGELIRADSDYGDSSVDDLTDYEDEVEQQQEATISAMPLRSSSEGDELIIDGNDGDVGRYQPVRLSSQLLNKLEGIQQKTTQSRSQGFTVGNSIIAD